MTYIQQGDVLLFNEEIDLTGLTKIESNVIQEGEHTGHAHRLFDGEYAIYEKPKTKERFLRIVEPTILKHEEHKPIKLPPGTYRIGIVKEYDHFAEEARKVRD